MEPSCYDRPASKSYNKIEWGSVNHAENRYPSVTKHKIRMCVQGGHSLRSPVKIDNIIKEKSSISLRISDNQHQATKHMKKRGGRLERMTGR